ncbi:MAG TPA: hypothetical protein VMV15_10440 [Candidatus Binataceae bacterium]|nr:hypothetical protein [Candidatus Binataceae bacterium]
MPTFFWVVYDVVLGVVGFFLLERKLTRKDWVLVWSLIAIGVAVAVYSGISDHEESALIASLKEGQDFTKGQLDVIGHLLGGQTNLTTANDLKEKLRSLRSLQTTVASLQQYKNAREAEEWPALNERQIRHWAAVLSQYPMKRVAIAVSDPRSERFVISLKEALKLAGWPVPKFLLAGPTIEGMRIDGSPVPSKALARLAAEINCVEPEVDSTGRDSSLPGGMEIYIGARCPKLK